MSNTFGKEIKLSVFGQSHSYGIGFSLDGFPAGVRIDMDELKKFMSRRAPGQNDLQSQRKEKDELKIVSGLIDGLTCGAPIAGIILNEDVKKGDYDKLKNIPRPGHADFTSWAKYGDHRDKTGGGQFSGRLTAPICAAGGLTLQLLKIYGIEIGAHIKSIHGIKDDAPSKEAVMRVCDKIFPTISDEAAKNMIREITLARSKGDSVGGIIECMIFGVPLGIGDPMFEGMEGKISQAIFAIPAVKGVEFGAGFLVDQMYGSENNDAFYLDGDRVMTRTNNSGGILGGITDGMPIIFSCAIKPTPSISICQDSVDLEKKAPYKLKIEGRHDPCIVPRAVPVVEAACALAICDSLIESGMIMKGHI